MITCDSLWNITFHFFSLVWVSTEYFSIVNMISDSSFWPSWHGMICFIVLVDCANAQKPSVPCFLNEHLHCMWANYDTSLVCCPHPNYKKAKRDGCAHYCQPILSTSSCLMLGVVQNSAGYKLYFMPFHNPPLLSNPKNTSVTVLVLHVPADFVIRVTIHFQSGFLVPFHPLHSITCKHPCNV